jgi:hypothetical protein
VKRPLLLCLMFFAALAGGAIRAPLTSCGPFTDVSPGFCPFVLTLYYSGITAGTSATTFSPDLPATRGQAAVFVGKSMQVVQRRASRRAALGQWWTTQSWQALGQTTVGSLPFAVVSDGADLWVTVTGDGVVARVRASDGKLLGTWTGATNALAIQAAMGRIFLTTNYPPDVLYMIDPGQPPGAVVPVSDPIDIGAYGIAFDGSRLWTTSALGSVSIIQPGPTTPWPVSRITTGFQAPVGILFDGSSIWVGDQLAESLFRLDSSGAILQTVPLLGQPGFFTFDGENLWVPVGGPGNSSSVVIVRAATGAVIERLGVDNFSGTGAAAFDGERVLVTRLGDIRIWRAADFALLATVSAGPFSSPFSVCSDGVNFWITLNGTGQLARF